MEVEQVVIIILLLYVVYKLHKLSSETLTPIESGYVGSNVNPLGLISSGADLRILGTRFSDPSQGGTQAQSNLNLPPSVNPFGAKTYYKAGTPYNQFYT